MKSKQSQAVPGLAVENEPRSMASEAFRTLQTTLQFLRPGQDVTTVLITSTEPGSGKTTVAANLAVTCAIREECSINGMRSAQTDSSYDVFCGQGPGA